MLAYNLSLNSSGVSFTSGHGENAKTTTLLKFPRFLDPRAARRTAENNKFVAPPDFGITADKPVPATRGGETSAKDLSYVELKDKLLREGYLFEDPEFPANSSSLFYTRAAPYGITWLRPHEICKNPEFITGGASRFDVRQGELGDCWLLAAIACLTMNDEHFSQVVPGDQSFTNGYCGLFRFHFWRFGEWKEVVVDDRLPTMRGQLIFIHSTEKNEFWSALLEKAYAKVCGSYEALKGGSTSEALEDFTGGIAEMFELRTKAPPDLFQIMMKSHERGSFLASSIQPDPRITEAELPNGLIMGHAYSITSVKLVDISIPGRTGRIPLVRLRNPWGNESEWKGAWSDKSREWTLLSDQARRELGLTFDNDGEFWMSYEDFCREFEKLEMCHRGPQSMGGHDQIKGRCWEMCVEHGGWQSRVSAGGCRNYLETFWINPQFRVTVTDPDEDDDDDMCTMIVGLMQKHRRKMRALGADLLTVGYAIYALPPNSPPTLGLSFFKYNASQARSPAFINLREVCGRHRLKPGHYVIIPSTFEPNQEAEFLLRIFTEKKATAEEMDETAGFNNPTVPSPIMTPDQSEALRNCFFKVAGEDGEIDYEELQDILNVVFLRAKDAQYFKFDGFTLESCRSMTAMMDYDRSGMLSFVEFEKLWNLLRLWKRAFIDFDKDKNGWMDSTELRNALKSAGFVITNAMLATLVIRFSRRDGKVLFDDYVSCCARLHTLFETFEGTNKTSDGQAIIGKDQFINSVLYM